MVRISTHAIHWHQVLQRTLKQSWPSSHRITGVL